MGRKLEGSTNRLSNSLFELLSERSVEEGDVSRLMNILDYRVSFNSESFRESVLAKKCGLFEIVMSKLIDDVCCYNVVMNCWLVGWLAGCGSCPFLPPLLPFSLFVDPFLTFAEALRTPTG